MFWASRTCKTELKCFSLGLKTRFWAQSPQSHPHALNFLSPSGCHIFSQRKPPLCHHSSVVSCYCHIAPQPTPGMPCKWQNVGIFFLLYRLCLFVKPENDLRIWKRFWRSFNKLLIGCRDWVGSGRWSGDLYFQEARRLRVERCRVWAIACHMEVCWQKPPGGFLMQPGKIQRWLRVQAVLKGQQANVAHARKLWPDMSKYRYFQWAVSGQTLLGCTIQGWKWWERNCLLQCWGTSLLYTEQGMG